MTSGEQLKFDGMKLVDENADPDWKHAADRAVEDLALTRRMFTSDDVRALLATIETHELRALGPVMLRAARKGLIAKAGFDYSTSPSRHKAPVQVWRSLLHEAVS